MVLAEADWQKKHAESSAAAGAGMQRKSDEDGEKEYDMRRERD
jgi:hypothetical protein